MADMYIAKLSAQHANWLSVRQSLIAGNIANANTPGFKALDVRELGASYSDIAAMARTHSSHITATDNSASGVGIKPQTPWDIYHSGGNVSLPQEMLKSSEVASAFQMNTSVMKSFHRMVVSVFGS